MGRVLVLVPDLMLASRVEATLAAAGHDVVMGTEPDGSLSRADLVVADVGDVEPGSVAGRGVPVLGVHRHTDPDTRARAEAAGVDLVVPRSRLARELPQLVDRLLRAS
ncbi:MAG TPA: hypothetical protein VH391_09150 [Solirubrobacterales bacterium]|jgi:hypothetical protein